MSLVRLFSVAAGACLLFTGAAVAKDVPVAKVAPAAVKAQAAWAAEAVTLKHKIVIEDAKLVLGGQPKGGELAAFAKAGVKTVINMRSEGEDFVAEEKAAVEALGMRYKWLPIARKGAGITVENAKKLAELLKASEGATLVHCRSGNRVGAIFALDAFSKRADLEAAITFGKTRGLTKLEARVREVLKPAK